VLTPEQETNLDEREPDVRLCTHQVELTEMGNWHGPAIYLLRLKGHMVMEGDEEGEDGMVHVDDHRLFNVEIIMPPVVWDEFLRAMNEADREIKNLNASLPRTYEPPTGRVPMEDIARFLGSIPEIFRHRKGETE
jgi:hypothetical protein